MVATTEEAQERLADSGKLMPVDREIPSPVKPNYSIGGSIASILSLIFMSVVCTVIYLQLANPQDNLIAGLQAQLGPGLLSDILNFLRPPVTTAALATWTWVPFLFTIFGATLGWVFELGLLITGTPFQQTRSPFTRFIQRIRFLNLAPVTTSLFFFVCSMMVPDPELRLALMCISGAACFALGFALFFITANPVIPIIMLGVQVLQFIMVLAAGIPMGGVFLLVQAALQFTALIIGTATPLRSTAFHTISTISAVALYGALLQATSADANFSHQVAILLLPGSFAKWAFIAACVVGLIVGVKVFPGSYGSFRTSLSVAIWTPIYFALVANPRFPNPHNLTKVFEKYKQEKTPLKPYYLAHPAYLKQKLGIPAVEVKNIEPNVMIFEDLVKMAIKLFALIRGLDHNIPQANPAIPIKDKMRMNPLSNGDAYWPKMFSRSIFGLTIPNGGKLERAPDPAKEAFAKGQLLAYLAESGVANPFLEKGRTEGELMIDLRFLEKFETKPDYESYGGMAYFRINVEKERLELVSVVAPHSQQEVPADPDNPTFRYAESLFVASVYYQVISAKHLGEIHMTYNLVEVCMHNAFDAQGAYAHPFRTFMYLHFFSHQMAEEVTTEHLVQETAVFTQVFATTHNALVQHLTETYSNFEYGIDEDFEARADLMRLPNSEIIPNACIKWELEYFDIWNKYTTGIIDIIYDTDADVAADSNVQDFHTALLEVMIQGLPERYDAFKTKKGLARFATDTIHHTVVRHQVYGTTGIRAAIDPTISKVQVPRDMGPYAVNEWRALAYVALATGQSRFTLLAGQDFTYLLDGVDGKYKAGMAKIFDNLQTDLSKLDAAWTVDHVEKTFNYDYFRAVPSDLHTGPGY